MNLSGHQSARMGSDTWLTPPEILKALGRFDLDPACPPVMPWPTADRMLTEAEDGLTAPWEGRVWLNPPFGQQAALWLRRMAQHGNGIALVPARTETAMFYESVWSGAADSICFLKGRPHFHYPDGRRADFNSGAPIALVAYGRENTMELIGAQLGIVLLIRIDTAVPLPASATKARASTSSRKDDG